LGHADCVSCLQRAIQIAIEAQDAAHWASLALAREVSRARLVLNNADRDEVSDPFMQDLCARLQRKHEIMVEWVVVSNILRCWNALSESQLLGEQTLLSCFTQNVCNILLFVKGKRHQRQWSWITIILTCVSASCARNECECLGGGE
jgi:hypothetical protein